MCGNFSLLDERSQGQAAHHHDVSRRRCGLDHYSTRSTCKRDLAEKEKKLQTTCLASNYNTPYYDRDIIIYYDIFLNSINIDN